MKSTGIVRKIDELGRLVIPKEIRRTFRIEEKDPIEILVDEDRIVLQKYAPNKACMVTGEVSDDNVSLFDGKIRLSKEGAKRLLTELEGQFQKA